MVWRKKRVRWKLPGVRGIPRSQIRARPEPNGDRPIPSGESCCSESKCGTYTGDRRTFTSGIHDSMKNTDRKKTTANPRHKIPGSDLHKTRNEPIPDFRRVPFPLFPEPIPHLFVLCHSPHVPNSSSINPPRYPHATRNEHRAGSVGANRAFDDPASTC